MSKKVVLPTKTAPVWRIGILFPDGKKIVKPRCTLNDLMDTYFLNLDRYITNIEDPEKLYELYQKTYSNKGIKVGIEYIDSWGHLWKGKVAWPVKDKFIEYLNKRIND